MRREEALDPCESALFALAEWLVDEEVGRRVACTAQGDISPANLLERGGEPLRVARQERPRGVGEVFTPTADGELNELRC